MTNRSLLSQLRGSISGRVIAPGDTDHDRARAVFYPFFNRRPAVIVRPADARDVSRVVSLAAHTGLELAVGAVATVWPAMASPMAGSCSISPA